MIRDPRDRYASALTRWKVIRGRVGTGTARWLQSVGLARRNQQRYPDRYKVVCYEVLAAQPEAMLGEICDFLGEAYTPVMLDMEGAPSHRDKGGNSSYGKREPGRISTGSIGRFRKVLSKRELAFMQLYARREMDTYGYTEEPIHFSLGDRVLFTLVDWPANIARVVAWHVSEAIQEHTGRAPSPHTIVD